MKVDLKYHQQKLKLLDRIKKSGLNMSIQDVKTIDSIGIPNDSQDTVSLAISDHLVWGEPIEEHLYTLQEKINSYVAFIESGELYDAFPESKGKSVKIIEVYFKYDLPEQAFYFLKQVSDMLKSINIGLKYKVLQ